jgi:hypothetical protein
VNTRALFQAFNAAIALRDAARQFKGSSSATESVSSTPPPSLQTNPQVAAGQVEARLTGVVIAALKEAFDRDHARLELERARLDEERRRAEAALRLELRRQAADRELIRLRWLGATALVAWIVSIGLTAARFAGTSTVARLVLGAGWILLLAALGIAFTMQARIARSTASDQADSFEEGSALPVWLLMGGLAATAISLLV